MDPIDAAVVPVDEEEPVAKEMFDATYEHVDAVKGPAHGMKFVVLKAGQEQDYESVMKAKYSAEQQRDMLAKGEAFKAPDGTPSYPIGDGDDLDKAIHAVGRGGADHDAIRAYIIRRAKALGQSGKIPENWAADGSLKKEASSVTKQHEPAKETEPQPVAKADGDLDAGELLAEPDGGADGSATAPSSAAWESVDAATARKWTAILSRARAALDVLFDREQQEVALGSDGDVDDAWNLDDARCAVDYAISVLATHAAGEQAEADVAQEALDGVAKALPNLKAEDLETIESLTAVKKAGRVLSASNEQAIRDAVSSLQKVLASLPSAPADVAKALKAKAPAPKKNELGVTEARERLLAVAKAKGDPMVPVYDADGNLCGMVEADDIVPIADAPGASKEPAPAPPEDGKEVAPAAADGTPAAPAAPAAEPSGAATVAPAEEPPDQQAVAKSMSPEAIAELIKSEVEKAVKARDEEHQSVVKSLKDRLDKIEHEPAKGGPLLAGANLGGLKALDGHQVALRGQTDPVEDAELVRITKALEATKDPVEQAQLLQELSTRKMAIRLGSPVVKPA